MSQSVGRAGGHQKPVNKSSKTAWIKRKLKSAADEDLSQQFLHEQTRSPPVGGSQGGNWSAQQTHPQQKGPGFDQDGNYTGDTYVYSPESDKLERQSTVQHNLNHRDLSSFSSTSAQASTAWYADGESREEQRSSSVARRPLSPSAILPSAAVLSAAERPSDSERLRQLSHIETWLLGAIQKNPELAGPEFESAEDTIVRIVDQYERLFASKNILQPDDYAGAKRTNLVKARDEVRAANTVLQDNNKKLEKELTKLRDNNSKLESTRSKLEGTRSVLLEKTARMNKEYKELEKRMERDSETLNSQIARLRFQKHEMTTSHTDKLRTLQISKEREIDDLKRGYEEKLRFLQVDRDTHLSGWTQSHKAHEALQADLEARQRSAKADAEDRMREFEGNCDRKMQKERRDYEERIRSLEADKERLNKSLQEAMSHKDKALLSQKQELAKLHEDEKKNLQTVIEDFKVATSSREHFKGLTDSEAAGRYTRLATKIEDFSRLEWDFSKEHDWPLTEDRMRVLSNNSRKLKQQIVQNSLWVCLYHYIFQSPFQIMGNEGRELDEQWTSIYAAGRSSSDWPQVSAEAERARYETAKTLMSAVEPSAIESALKSSFEDSIIAAMTATCHALRKVARIQEDHRKSLQSILGLAAKTWLEVCSQRYRLIVLLPDGFGDILSSKPTDESPFTLIVKPDLKRYGDSQGSGLMRGELLGGWKGLVQTYGQ